MKQEFWKFDEYYYKVYLEDPQLKDLLAQKDSCKVHCRYYHKDGKYGWDILVPRNDYQDIVRLIKS